MATSDVTLKTAVNTRLPLSARMAKQPQDTERTALVASMHNPLESTYDVDYSPAAVQGTGGITQRTLCGATNRFSWKGASSHDNGVPRGGIQPNESEGPFRAGSRAFSTGAEVADKVDAANGSAHVRGDVAVVPSTHTAGASGSDANALPKAALSPSVRWESESHAATRGVQPEQRLDFYASVRKEEQVDDDNRGSLVGATQRAVDIRAKRASALQMCPPEATYRPADPVEGSLVAAQEKLLLRRNYLDLVECEHTNPDTEQQMGFGGAPEDRLAGRDLPWDIPTQSKAITRMGTSEDMFRGTAKYLDDRPVGYAGHVPVADRNLQSIHTGVDARRAFAKSCMTLAVHGGGVDASITSNNLRARHCAGKNSTAPKMLNPKSEGSIQQTVEGKMLYQSLHDTVAAERTMNVRSDQQAEHYF